MSYIKHQRDRREYDLKRALEAHLLWRPRLTLGLNKDAIEEEFTISNDRIWAMPEATFQRGGLKMWGSR